MKKILLALLLLVPISLLSQSNPSAYKLSDGNYSFLSWSSDATAGTYPNNMMFHTTKVRDPKLEDEMDSDWNLAYNLSSRSRIIGLGELGFAFQNTSGVQEDGNYMGAALLSLDASGRGNISIEWIARTISPGDRTYKIVLQYRIGSQGAFTTLPSEYTMVFSAGDFKLMPITVLPDECNGKPLVQVRWKYCYVETGMTGTRPALAVDNILVSSTEFSSIADATINDFYIFGRNLKLNNFSLNDKIEIYDLLGNKVFAKDLTTSQETLDLSSLNKGYYIVALISENRIVSRKVVLD